MAIPFKDDHKNAELWTQTPNADQVEKVIDYILSDPFYRAPSASPATGVGTLRIRVPDATIITEEVLAEVRKRYIDAGWMDVTLHYGDTPETEYQTTIIVYYKRTI